jgi:ATPase subunit of ABC transporter with duplicated ATPase domains
VDPPTATVGYLAQEHEEAPGETVRGVLAGRTGCRAAETELTEAAAALADGTVRSERRYEMALERFNRLGVGDLDARIGSILDDLGLGAEVAGRPAAALSGGQRAKVALAGVELSRFDITLLDEPTNDLDFEGLRRLEDWVRHRSGGMVIVSHDRHFLDRTVTSVLEIDVHQRSGTEYGGGWAGYRSERETARRHATDAYQRYDRRRGELEERAERQRQWATTGVRRESRTPRDNDKAQRSFRVNRTEKLAAKARSTDRARDALPVVEKPWEGWDLRFTIGEAPRAGAVVARLEGAVVERGDFTLGPIDLEIGWGDRLSLTGANGTGKSTLVGAVLGTVPLASGGRWLGPGVVVGQLGQDRRTLLGRHDLVRTVMDRCGLTQAEARSLLAKFGLDAEHVTRPPESLSPGERTRAQLAVFQGVGVNFLVLDEPTNHLDLPAIEQLEAAVAGFDGTLLLVSHDRQFIEAVETTRAIQLG